MSTTRGSTDMFYSEFTRCQQDIIMWWHGYISYVQVRPTPTPKTIFQRLVITYCVFSFSLLSFAAEILRLKCFAISVFFTGCAYAFFTRI